MALWNTSSHPITHHHITKDLFTEASFTQYIMSSFQENIMRHTTRQTTQFEETEQASDMEPEPDMAEMLGLSDWEFKTTMINMLRALMKK